MDDLDEELLQDNDLSTIQALSKKRDELAATLEEALEDWENLENQLQDLELTKDPPAK